MVTNRHDRVFREIMADPDYFVALCQAYLPKRLQQRVNWKTVTNEKLPTDWVKNLAPFGFSQEKQGDVLYSFCYADGEQGLFLVLAEHQSTQDPYLALRLAIYLHLLLLEYAKAKKLKKLPTVVQLVVYHGKKTPYVQPLRVIDMFADHILAKKYYMQPVLVNLNDVKDDELIKHGLIAPLEFVLKRVYQKRPPEEDMRRFCLILASTYTDESLPEAARVVLYYLLSTVDFNEKRFVEILEETLPQYKGDIMTIAERLEKRGMKKGMQQGMQQGMQEGIQEGLQIAARNMIKKGAKAAYIHEVLALPKSEIAVLIKEVKKSQR